jgi:hypothetical protein
MFLFFFFFVLSDFFFFYFIYNSIAINIISSNHKGLFYCNHMVKYSQSLKITFSISEKQFSRLFLFLLYLIFGLGDVLLCQYFFFFDKSKTSTQQKKSHRTLYLMKKKKKNKVGNSIKHQLIHSEQ